MDISSLTIAEAREIARMFSGDCGRKTHSWQLDEKVFIRTVTMYYTGRVVAITDEDVVLDDAAWIPDTGRFSEAMSTGVFAEVEPFPGSVCVPRGGIIDWCEFNYELPRTRKP